MDQSLSEELLQSMLVKEFLTFQDCHSVRDLVSYFLIQKAQASVKSCVSKVLLSISNPNKHFHSVFKKCLYCDT